MAIPYIPYEGPRFSDLMGIARNNLDAQLARERMMVEDARAKQVAAQREREDERQHQQQMAMFGLNEMKANYEMQQGQPGGLKYQQTMAQIGQYNSAADENSAHADYYRRRTENPAAFRNPPASARPRVIPLTSGQIKANADAAAMGQPAPYQPTITTPGNYGADYTGANVNNPNDPALVGLQASLAAGASGAPMPGESDPYTPVTGPVANEPGAGELPSGQGSNDMTLLDPSIIPAPNPSGPPVYPPAINDPSPSAPPRNGQGPLPMDPASVQRRDAMEADRLKKESSLTMVLNQRRKEAKARILAANETKEKDPIAEMELQQVEKELRRIITPAPKAEIVLEDSTMTTTNSAMANTPAGSAVLDPATGWLVPANKSAPAPAAVPAAPNERPGIGLLPADTTESDQRKRSEFWDDGKAQAFRLAKLDLATDAELQAIVDGANPDEPGEMNFSPLKDGMTYAEKLAAEIKGQFKAPPWSDNAKAKNRSGDVETEEFIREAANDEINRRKTVAPKTSGVTYRKTKSPDAPK